MCLENIGKYHNNINTYFLNVELGAGGEGDDRGWDGWMASLTRWMWVWVNSGSWWWTGRPGVLRFMGSQKVGHDWVTELNWMWNYYILLTSDGSSKKQESSRKTSISALLTMAKPLTVWTTINCGKFWKRWGYQTTWHASWETYMQVRKQQLELDME